MFLVVVCGFLTTFLGDFRCPFCLFHSLSQSGLKLLCFFACKDTQFFAESSAWVSFFVLTGCSEKYHVRLDGLNHSLQTILHILPNFAKPWHVAVGKTFKTLTYDIDKFHFGIRGTATDRSGDTSDTLRRFCNPAQLECGFPNPQARKDIPKTHARGILKVYFFGLKILIFNCVGLQIPRGRDRGCSILAAHSRTIRMPVAYFAILWFCFGLVSRLRPPDYQGLVADYQGLVAGYQGLVVEGPEPSRSESTHKRAIGAAGMPHLLSIPIECTNSCHARYKTITVEIQWGRTFSCFPVDMLRQI